MLAPTDLKRNLRYLILVVGILISNQLCAQKISNEGKEFWIPFPTMDQIGDSPANITIRIISKSNSEVTVSCGTHSEKKTILANQITLFAVPRVAAYINAAEGNTVLTNRAIHVVTTAGQPNVNVYADIFEPLSAASSLILPVDALGNQYYSMNFTQDNDGRNFLVLVAVNDNTTLIIRNVDGTSKAITLPRAGDVYEYYAGANVDLTGTIVEVDDATSQCKRFAAFSGSTSTTLGCDSRDALFQQLYPPNSWGKVFGLFYYSQNVDYRILAKEDNTKVTVDAKVFTLNKGEKLDGKYYGYPVLMIKADKAICVAQYFYGDKCSGDRVNGNPTTAFGDPDMVITPPFEAGVTQITLGRPQRNTALWDHGISLLIKTDKVQTLKMDGVPLTIYNSSFVVVPEDPSYTYVRPGIIIDKSTITAEGPFSPLAFYIGTELSSSYVFATGLIASEPIVLSNKSTTAAYAYACLGESLNPKFTSKTLFESLLWKPVGGSPYLEQSPNPTVSVVNGENWYTYTSPVINVFGTLGKVELSATGYYTRTADNCIINEEMDFVTTVTVDPLPKAEFSAITSACANQLVEFSDKSVSLIGKPIISWQWDFGDGYPIIGKQNPKHAFEKAGTYKVKLMVSEAVGCISNVFEIPITITPAPIASFTVSDACVGKEAVFVDVSTIDMGETLTKWTWSFADGTLISNTKTATYRFTAPGEYTVVLVTESANGCKSLPFEQKITVTTMPIASFHVPDICLTDGQVVFVNRSDNGEGATNGLSYVWDFNDPNATAVGNTSIAQDGKHTYTATGKYKVKLTVTNANGCSDVFTQDFTVNGSKPKAIFIPVDAQNICSSQTFYMENRSEVDFGSVTKLEWFINGQFYSADDEPEMGKKYPFKYPSSTIDQKIIVRLKAYSGMSCTDLSEQEVLLLGSPAVALDKVDEMCENSSPVQLNGYQLTNLTGNTSYSGKGVNPVTGMFDPALAGAGSHTITYTFIPLNGCSATQEITIKVLGSPLVDAGSDVIIISGGEKQLNAKVSSAVKYQWTPSIGLSDDKILDPIASPENDTKYILTATSALGCTSSDEVFVRVQHDLEPPNSFTPNGDGINDVWSVKYLDSYLKALVEIYDRKGQRIFISKGYAVPFDGKYKNQQLPVGTYYYIINPNNGKKSITGNLTIIR
jgi:gliding motility-associated-like protein